MKTICKTWGCQVCRFKRASYVKAMMLRGCYSLDPCYLITLTLRAGNRETHGAVFVNKAWTALVRYLKERSRTLSWFKVIESTKKGTPHLHLMVGGIGQRIANGHGDRHGKNVPYSVDFIHEDCRKDCLIHEWGLEWFKLTTAYVVDAKRIYNPEGAARYLAKYLVKGFLDRENLSELGFGRRYSMSRNWPRGESLRLRGSVDGSWESTEIIPRWFKKEEMEERCRRSEGSVYTESVGDNLLLEIGQRTAQRVKKNNVERIQDAVFPSYAAT